MVSILFYLLLFSRSPLHFYRSSLKLQVFNPNNLVSNKLNKLVSGNRLDFYNLSRLVSCPSRNKTDLETQIFRFHPFPPFRNRILLLHCFPKRLDQHRLSGSA